MLSDRPYKVGDKLSFLRDISQPMDSCGYYITIAGKVKEVRWGNPQHKVPSWRADEVDWQYLLDNGEWIDHDRCQWNPPGILK